jgi:hypothetical protein
MSSTRLVISILSCTLAAVPAGAQPDASSGGRPERTDVKRPGKAKPPVKAKPRPDFEERRKRAVAAKQPGGQPDSEAKVRIAQIARRHDPKNDRVRRIAPARPGVEPTKDMVYACTGKPFEIHAVQTTPPLDPGDSVTSKAVASATIAASFAWPVTSPEVI